jgi:hypothetical protein
MKSFWVVSPNVGGRAAEWKQIILREHVAVMGWGPNHRIGEQFIRSIEADNVILVARRHEGKAEVVGLGIVRGPAELGNTQGKLKRFTSPSRFGSLRNLAPFVHVRDVPKDVPLMEAVNHSRALAELHPKRNPAHKRVCDWMDRLLQNENRKRSKDLISRESRSVRHDKKVRLVKPPENRDYDYTFQPKSTIVKAQKKEAELLETYRSWIQEKYGYMPRAIKALKLTNDCFDERRRNLIEAKASTKREDIRMAVGQLFDYGFYAERQFGKLNRAILLPRKPPTELVEWLLPLNISLIWRRRGAFRDNANKRFV